MTSQKRLRLWALAPTLVAAACAGTRLNDVGDIRGDTAGIGGVDGSDGPGGDATGGTKAPGAGKGPGNTGTTSGAGGARPVDEDDPPLEGEAGFGPDAFELECQGCEIVAKTPDIRAIAIGADHVYWLEYGSRDALGNYLDDGRLLSQPLDGGETAVIASDLQGPVELQVSDDFAYAIVDQSSAAAGTVQLIRFGLATGESEIVQRLAFDPVTDNWLISDWFRRFFVVHDGTAFWVEQGKLYRLGEDTASTPEPMLELEAAFFLAGDSSQLYLYDTEGIKALPYAGGSPTLLRAIEPDGVDPATWQPSYWQMQVDAGFIYAYEPVGEYLVRMAVTGGTWKRVAEIGPQQQLIVEGGAYFHDPHVSRPDPLAGCTIEQGVLDASKDPVRLAAAPCFQRRPVEWPAWAVAPSSVFFGWDGQLYRVPRLDP